MLINKKKGQIEEIIITVIIVFFLAVSFIIVAYVNDKFSTIIKTTDLNDTDTAQVVIHNLDNITTNTIQNSFVFLFAFIIIGIIASSFLVKYHPIFIFIFIIFSVVGIILAAILGNVYHQVATIDEFANIAGQQTKITWIMEHIVEIMVGVAGLSLVVLFARLPSSGGQFD